VGLFDSQRSAARREFSGGRMLSSGFRSVSDGLEPSDVAGGSTDSPAGLTSDLAAASSEADDSGMGEFTGELGGASSDGRGTAGGAGSLARGALTEVSPVNGFLYSVTGVITSTAVGL
jgi:hypothetical protein